MVGQELEPHQNFYLKPELEPHKNDAAPKHWLDIYYGIF
jgi:hypothetical protein